MASDTVFDAIQAHIATNWTATPVVYENEDSPDVLDSQGRPSPWVMVEMTGTLYGQQSIGAFPQEDNRWDEEGQLWLHVFVARGTGGREARGYAKQLADLFRGTLLNDSIEFLDATIGMGEPGDEEGQWFRISVSVDWRRWEA